MDAIILSCVIRIVFGLSLPRFTSCDSYRTALNEIGEFIEQMADFSIEIISYDFAVFSFRPSFLYPATDRKPFVLEPTHVRFDFAPFLLFYVMKRSKQCVKIGCTFRWKYLQAVSTMILVFSVVHYCFCIGIMNRSGHTFKQVQQEPSLFQSCFLYY